MGNQKVIVIPNGVKINDKVTEQFQFSPKFIYVGAIIPRKRVLETIKYFLENYAELEGAELKIIGPLEGLDESHDDYVKRCKSVIPTNLISRVRWMGKLSQKEVMDELFDSRIILLFSENEGMPNVILEGMANGCIPIVSSMKNIASFIIDDKIDGFITDDFKKIELCALEDVWSSKKSFYKVKTKFSIESIAQMHLNYYKNL